MSPPSRGYQSKLTPAQVSSNHDTPLSASSPKHSSPQEFKEGHLLHPSWTLDHRLPPSGYSSTLMRSLKRTLFPLGLALREVQELPRSRCPRKPPGKSAAHLGKEVVFVSFLRSVPAGVNFARTSQGPHCAPLVLCAPTSERNSPR